MTPSSRRPLVVALLLIALAAMLPAMTRTAPAAAPAASAPAMPMTGGRSVMPPSAAHAGAPTQEMVDGFADAVDLAPLSGIAVHGDGRIRSFDSYAKGFMRFITGPRWINGQRPTFTYLDMILRPERYQDRAIHYVKNKLVRQRIADALRRSVEMGLASQTVGGRPLSDAERQQVTKLVNERLERFQEYGLAWPSFFGDPEVATVLETMSRDLLRTAKSVQQVQTSLGAANPELMRGRLNLLPPPSGSFDEQWHTLDELAASPEDPMFRGLDATLKADLVIAWRTFTDAWGRSDAAATNGAIVRLAELLPQSAEGSDVYPAQLQLELESWYFGARNMTWVWIIYGFAFVPLTLSVVFRWKGAFWLGMALFTAALALQTASVGIRWYVSGRWPNSNMFEAVTTAAWFGGVFAFGSELFVRRLPLRGMLALGSAAASAVALMAAYYLPAGLDPHLSNRMPVLLDVWLYIHTNVIIFAYCLVFMAAVTGGLYLILRGVRFLRGDPWGSGRDQYARAGGAASIIMTTPDGGSIIQRERTTVAQVLDGTTMILIELSFILLWAGLVMGAIWADHSWGRPWGWDPKEVFALNTFIVFAVLVHVRFKSKDKGLWTAIIALIGCAVMLFNWIIINFTIAGLHSYA